MGVYCRVPYIGYFSKKLPDVKEPSLSHIQNCEIFFQNGWIWVLYTCGLVCQMPKTPTIYISRHENGGIQEGTIYWLFFKEIARCRKSQACHIFKTVQYFSRMDRYEYLYMRPSMPDAENPNNLYFKTWKWRYTQGTIYWLFFKKIAGCRREPSMSHIQNCAIFFQNG